MKVKKSLISILDDHPVCFQHGWRSYGGLGDS